MKKTLVLLAVTSFIAFYSCQSTKTEPTEVAADSINIDASAIPMEESLSADSTLSSDSTIIMADSIQ